MLNFRIAGDPPASSRRVAVIQSAAKDLRLFLAHHAILQTLIDDTANAKLCNKGTASAGPATPATNDPGFSPCYLFLG